MSAPEDHPTKLIPALCRQFYDLGWVTGTGGGISIRNSDGIYIAPSGVQKERMQVCPSANGTNRAPQRTTTCSCATRRARTSSSPTSPD